MAGSLRARLAIALLLATAWACAGPPSQEGPDAAVPAGWPCARGDVCGGTMVTLTGGTFLMGLEPGSADNSEAPAREVTVPTFRIDREEVTTGAFAEFLAFLAAGGRANQCAHEGSPASCYQCADPDATIDCSAAHAVRSSCQASAGGPADRSCGDHPVTHVTWYGCRAYCAAVGKRLPTEAEWERAARGPSSPGRRFPWGDDCPTSFASDAYLGDCADEAWTTQTARASCADDACADGFVRTAPVGVLSVGATPEGIADLAGNVWEWTEDCWHRSYGGAPTDGTAWTSGCSLLGRVQRGGSWFHDATALRVTHRAFFPPGDAHAALGCRCAVSD